MTKMTDKPVIPRRTGMTHGVRAFIDSGKIPSGRQYRRAMKEVNLTRDRLIIKYGGDKIEPDVLAMVDTAAKAMMIQELCSLYIKRAGILRRDSLDKGDMELHSVLAKSYASYANLVRLSLEAAARLANRKQQTSSQAALETYLTSFSRVDEPEPAEERPTVPQDGQTARGEGDTMGDDQADDKGRKPLVDIKKGDES
jgi:hypothetical protein